MQNHLIKHALFFITGASLLLSARLPAQSRTGEALDSYIQVGLENNHALQQKELDLQNSLRALKEAAGLFYPAVNLEAQYFMANGGRTTELPVGDLLNPVYSTLNDILESMGQPGEFPQIENQTVDFLPNDYHDTKFRITTPLINSEIYFNYKIRKEFVSAAQAEVNVYKRELIKEIKTAYIRCLQTRQVVEAYNSALGLINETMRVNTKLVENQMAGPERLYRIEAEQNKVQAQLSNAKNDMNTAVSYFNFLLNRPLLEPVTTDSVLLDVNVKVTIPDQLVLVENREEIMQLNSYIKSAGYNLKLNQAYLFPDISNVTDLGYQGYSYKFSEEQQYFMSVFSLSVPIFSGMQNRNKIARARIETEILQSKLSEAELQIQLQCQVAQDNLASAIKTEQAIESALSSSKEYYKIINKQYALGQKALLDLLDARNALTNAQINYIMSHFETLIKLAELERVTASYNLYN